ncbi:MAG: hypothetical protein QXG00_00340 [Candidatus Woesearchaeota archaeon]
MQKRGQFTIFILLVIVIIFVFGFMFYAKLLLQSNRNIVLADKALSEFILQSSLQKYVTDCLEITTNEGLILLGEQGGRIYNTSEQQGLFEKGILGVNYLVFNTSNNSYDVSYGVIPNTLCPLVKLYPPEYPLEYSYFVNLRPHYIRSECNYYTTPGGFFGLNNITKLCNRLGSNRIGVSNFASLNISCDYQTYSGIGQISIQEQLEDYINKKLPSCINFSHYSYYVENITLKENINTTVTFGKSGFNVKVEFPFEVIVKGKPFLRYHSFSYDSNIRIINIYNYVFELIQKDVSDIYFNKTKEYWTLNSWDTNFNIKFYNNVQPNNPNTRFDDVIVITDNLSMMRGKPYLFQFSIKNRRPALDYIHQNDLQTRFIDLQIIENQTIYFYPNASDPDEDAIKYNYSGWKEDYDDLFDNSCQDTSLENISRCMIHYNTQQKNWTRSSLFLQTNISASYKTNSSDIGYHEVNISAWDDEGLLDFQTVKILIFDLPIAKINGSNLYNDIPDEFASVEDPYFFNAINSRVQFGGEINTYFWNGTTSLLDILLQVFYYNTTIPFLTIPGETFDILNIRPLNFSIPQKHNISLIVRATNPTRYSTPAILELDVKHCLPHRNNSFAFPYNTTDAWMANHSCCMGEMDEPSTWSLAPSTTICYNKIEWGQMNDFSDIIPFGHPINFNLQGISETNAVNDVFRREFTRKCDGERGNICNGDAQEIRTLETVCPDYDNINPGAERCMGPPTDPQPQQVMCVYYQNQHSAQTFEQIFGFNAGGGEQADGICNEAYACSSQNVYGEGGVFVAKAGCNTGLCNRPIINTLHCSDGIPNEREDIEGAPVCNAQCDDRTNDVRWNQNICENYCNYNSCTFTTHTTFCTQSNPICLVNNYCYKEICTPSQFQQNRDYCPLAGTVNGNICYYGTQSCDATGQCTLFEDINDCNSIQCNPNIGWVCP